MPPEKQFNHALCTHAVTRTYLHDLMTAWIPIRFTLEALGCNVGTLFVPTPSGFQGGKSAAFFTRRHRKIFALAKNTGAALYHPVSAFGTGGEDGWSVRPRLSSI